MARALRHRVVVGTEHGIRAGHVRAQMRPQRVDIAAEPCVFGFQSYGHRIAHDVSAERRRDARAIRRRAQRGYTAFEIHDVRRIGGGHDHRVWRRDVWRTKRRPREQRVETASTASERKSRKSVRARNNQMQLYSNLHNSSSSSKALRRRSKLIFPTRAPVALEPPAAFSSIPINDCSLTLCTRPAACARKMESSSARALSGFTMAILLTVRST